ncbi:MAG: AI-2E family transporter [Oscillospiraceae bacterium]
MSFFEKHKQLKLWLPAFIFVAAVICFDEALRLLPSIASAFGKITSIMMPFIVGFVFAFILYIPVGKLENFLEHRKNKLLSSHARGISVAVVYIVFAALVTLALSLVLPRIARSVADLVNQFPSYYDSTIQYVEQHFVTDGKIFGFDFNEIKNSVSFANIFSFIDFGSLSKYAAGVFKAGSTVIDTFLAFVISVYMLLGRDHLIHVCGKLMSLFIPPKRVHSTYSYIKKISDIFYSYIYSQLLDALIVSVLLGIAFSIIGVPYALLFAILIGICNLIPYFGAIIGGGVVALFTLFSNNLITAIIVGVTIIVIQQVDANLLQPKIVGNTVGIRPIYVLFAVTVGGGLMGIVGILIGVPLIATIRMIMVDIIAKRESAADPASDKSKKQE